jgi:hypothetical protein
MDKEEAFKLEGAHKFFGIELNQLVWSLLGKTERTAEEDELMLHAAHGSYFHWLKDGTNANKQRGQWLISRVYAALNVPERAMFHAEKCMNYTLNHLNEMEDFDIAYADEGMARAFACNGNYEEAKKYICSARDKGNKITDIEAKKYFIGDINAGPWFGMSSN